MKIPKAPRIAVKDQDIARVQNSINLTVDKICDNPTLNGVLLQNVDLVAGSNAVFHKLGKTPLGWWVTKTSGSFGSASVTLPFDPNPVKIRQIHTMDINQVDGGTETETITLPFAPRDGSTLVMAFFGGNPTVAIGFATPSQTNVTWTARNTVAKTGGLDCFLHTWSAQGFTSAGTTIVLTCAGASNIRGTACVVELTGCASASYDTSASVLHSAALQYASSPAVTPTTNASYYILWAGTNSGTPNAIGGYHVVGQVNNYIGGERIKQEVCVHARRNDSAQGYTLSLMSGPITAAVSYRCDIVPSVRTGNSTDTLMAAMVFKADSASGGTTTAITTPHGLTQTAVDDKYLTLTSADAVTVDLWVF